MNVSRFRTRGCLALLLALVSWLLGGCGGGGGGPGPVNVRFNVNSVEATSLEGTNLTADLLVTLKYGGAESLYVLFEDPGQLLADANAVQVNSEVLDVTLTFNGSLPPDSYKRPFVVHVCSDMACAHELPGSPASVPMHYVLKSNLHVATPAAMTRSGQEPGPSQTLAAVLPAEAGNISLRVEGSADAFSLGVGSNQVQIAGTQIRAGTYNAHVVVSGSADPRYQTSFDLQYVVRPPVTGETGLAVDVPYFSIALAQGQTGSYRFQVSRASWNPTLNPPTITGAATISQPRALGGDLYEFSVDANNIAIAPSDLQTSISASLEIDAGPLVGRLVIPISVGVGQAFSLSNAYLDVNVLARTTAAALSVGTDINASEGGPYTWHASSSQPWMKLARTTGRTGQDELRFDIDPSILANGTYLQSAELTLWLDKPGTLPYKRVVYVSNNLPRIEMASPGALLTGTTAQVTLHGHLADTEALVPGVLKAQGATIRSLQWIYDSRFVGNVGALQVDLSDIVPGQPVTLYTAAPLGATQVVLPSAVPQRLPTGFAYLPLAEHRPPSVSSTGAVYFTGGKTLWRWAPQAGVWPAPQSSDFAGLIDAALRPDETAVYALQGRQVVSVSTTSLTPLASATLFMPSDSVLANGGTYAVFDDATPSSGKVLAFAADGHALASYRPYSNPYRGHGAGWLCGMADFGQTSDLVSAPAICEPGSEEVNGSGADGGTALARSPLGHSLAISYPNGRVKIYRRMDESRLEPGSIPQGTTITAISDSGNWAAQSNGDLRARQFGWTIAANLASKLPVGYIAGGYGLSDNDNFALVYGYQIVQEASGPRARNAKLWVLDLYQAPVSSTSFSILAELALPEAVGCNTELEAGEACEHGASITVTPGNKNVIVLGPRGVISVPMPLELDSITAISRARAQATRQQAKPSSGRTLLLRTVH